MRKIVDLGPSSSNMPVQAFTFANLINNDLPASTCAPSQS